MAYHPYTNPTIKIISHPNPPITRTLTSFFPSFALLYMECYTSMRCASFSQVMGTDESEWRWKYEMEKARKNTEKDDDERTLSDEISIDTKITRFIHRPYGAINTTNDEHLDRLGIYAIKHTSDSSNSPTIDIDRYVCARVYHDDYVYRS